jgi:mono/diheme cytochrome c family protein
MRRLVLVVALAAIFGCDRSPGGAPATAEPWSDAWIQREGDRYLADGAYRRAALEASLVAPSNAYSRQRLDAYGLGSRGWDVLPVWNPKSRPITAELAAVLERGEMPPVASDQPPLWDGATPTTRDGWIALGRKVFFEYPLRAEVFAEHGLTRRALADAVGIERTADGAIPGLVVFANVDGATRVGITCAICHASVHDGALVVGMARRRFDYGKLRLAYHADTKTPVDGELAERMATWGPGRADVTEDDDEDPVAIPDLWGLRAQSHLTQAGTIRHASPLALAIRQETQLLHANHQRIRPPRELAWALAMFLYSLAPPAAPPPNDPARVARGRALFDEHCRTCHDNAAYGGDPVPAKMIGTDPALAAGTARGTGMYRPGTLLGIARGAPYLHHGAVASLDELLSPARLADDYKGRFGGPVRGHLAGTELAPDDRASLIAFLETL